MDFGLRAALPVLGLGFGVASLSAALSESAAVGGGGSTAAFAGTGLSGTALVFDAAGIGAAGDVIGCVGGAAEGSIPAGLGRSLLTVRSSIVCVRGGISAEVERRDTPEPFRYRHPKRATKDRATRARLSVAKLRAERIFL